LVEQRVMKIVGSFARHVRSDLIHFVGERTRVDHAILRARSFAAETISWLW
jgi:hypothetical protein